jgi:hypothetical protein
VVDGWFWSSVFRLLRKLHRQRDALDERCRMLQPVRRFWRAGVILYGFGGGTWIAAEGACWIHGWNDTTPCGGSERHHNGWGLAAAWQFADGWLFRCAKARIVERNDKRADDGLKARRAAETTKLRVLSVLASTGWTLENYNFFSFRFHRYSIGQAARMREAIARASSHICAASV